MIHEKMEAEAIYFTGSDYSGNSYGFNMYPDRVHPAALREHERRSTSPAHDNNSKESLEEVIQRVCKLLTLSPSHVKFVLGNLVKKNIKSNHDLYIAIQKASNMNNSNLSLDFMVLIKDNDASPHALGSNIHKEGLFLKASSTYMQRRWGYDHEYYQRMIDRNNRMTTTQHAHSPQNIPRNKEDNS